MGAMLGTGLRSRFLSENGFFTELLAPWAAVDETDSYYFFFVCVAMT